MIKKYKHFADNSNLDRQDNYAKVHPLYNLANKSLKQFGYWHQEYAIDEQMLLCYGFC